MLYRILALLIAATIHMTCAARADSVPGSTRLLARLADSRTVTPIAATPRVVVVYDTVTVYDTICPRQMHPLYLAVKSNMLYDAAAIPDLGVEVALRRGWSVALDWQYAWWRSERRHRYWRVYGGQLGVRKWFGRLAGSKPLQGHHAGVFGQIFTYDFEFGGKGHMGGVPDKNIFHDPQWGVSAEYGFSLPVARRLNIDFTVGAGYIGGVYREYVPRQGQYIWQSTRRRHWFGPTKAAVTLVWLIGRGNSNGPKQRHRDDRQEGGEP